MMGTPNPQSCPNTCEFSKSAYIWTKGADARFWAMAKTPPFVEVFSHQRG